MGLESVYPRGAVGRRASQGREQGRQILRCQGRADCGAAPTAFGALAERAVADMRALAAYLVWCARRAPHSPALVERLNPLHRFLEAHERLLPVRAVWLAWYHLVQLSGGDILALARAR